MLPQPPSWKSRVVSVEGGTTKAPLILFYLTIAWRRGILIVALLLGLLANVSMHCMAIGRGSFQVFSGLGVAEFNEVRIGEGKRVA